MSSNTALTAVICCLLWFTPLINALSPISVKGTKLYSDDGSQFFVKGVTYSRAVDDLDPLIDTSQCQIDAGLMSAIGVNTIRIYSASSTGDHDGCMQAFASQGIYVWLDLTTPSTGFNRVDPEWTMEMFTNWTTTLDTFAGYDNLLVFTAGNEVLNNDASTIAAPYVKAAVRDIKAFRDARGYRPIPIAYSAADLVSLRALTADYLACGDSSDTIDLYGLNVYSWCGNSSYYKAGYDRLYEEFQALNVPVVFSETGCNSQTRDFSDVSTMLGPVFQAVFSGAVVYEWTMEDNEYGIVEYSDEEYTGFPSTLDDYNALKTAFSTASPTGTSRDAYTPSNSAPACPTTRSSWSIDGDVTLPTIAGLELASYTARTTITTGSGTSTMTGNAASAATDALGDQDSSDETSGSSLSSGGIAGIAIGISVAAIAAALAAFFLIRRRKAAQKQQQNVNVEEIAYFQTTNGDMKDGYETDPAYKAELPAQSAGQILPRQELDAEQNWQDGHGAYSSLPVDSNGSGAGGHGNGYSQAYEMEGSIPPPRELDGRSG